MTGDYIKFSVISCFLCIIIIFVYTVHVDFSFIALFNLTKKNSILYVIGNNYSSANAFYILF